MTVDTATGRASAFVRAAMPTAAPSVILTLGRWWHTEGAAHSIGDATLMTALAAGALGFGVAARQGGGSLPTYCVGTAGGLAAAAIAGYASGLALPLITWAVASALTAIAALRSRKADVREATEHKRAMERERLRADTEIQREAIRAQSRIEVAAITGAWQARAAQITASTSPATRVDQIDPQLLELSPEARAALASPTVRLALAPSSRPADPGEEPDSCHATPQPEPTASAPLWRTC